MAAINELPLVVICGPTASGKTGLAIKIAKQCGGEIISADSRAVYRGLDIGTAKPTLEEREGVPHWGIDLVEPDERFTAADFKHYALEKIAEIRSRGHIPMLVGGTGLYIDSVIYDYKFSESDSYKDRVRYEAMTLNELYTYCTENNIVLPKNYKNKRHVIGNILRKGQFQQIRKTIIKNTIIVAISTNKEILRERITRRADDIFSTTGLEEACTMGDRYGWDNESMTGNFYPIAHLLLNRALGRDEAIARFIIADWHLAKRQLTWLRRNDEIMWLALDDAYTYIMHKLAGFPKIVV